MASTELDLSTANMQLVLAEWSPYFQRLSILCPCRSPIPSYRLLRSCNWDTQHLQGFVDWWWFMLFHLAGQPCISGSSRIGCGAGHEEGTILRLVSKYSMCYIFYCYVKMIIKISAFVSARRQHYNSRLRQLQKMMKNRCPVRMKPMRHGFRVSKMTRGCHVIIDLTVQLYTDDKLM